MNTKKTIALAIVTALGFSVSAAYADYDHERDYRHEHRDSREYRHDRYGHERRSEYIRRDYGPHGYIVERPVYVAPRVIYAQPMPPSLDIVIPIHF